MEAAQQAQAVKIWEQLGEEGRACVMRWIDFSSMPDRLSQDVMLLTDVERFTVTGHPIEKVAGAFGCLAGGDCACRTLVLRGKATMRHFSAGGEHAHALVRAFITDPHLAYPPDIPGYTQKLHAKALHIEADMRRKREKRERIFAREAALLAEKQARAAFKKSYAGRIEKAEKRVAHCAEAVAEAEKLVVARERKLRAARRSVAALVRAATKKGEPIK